MYALVENTISLVSKAVPLYSSSLIRPKISKACFTSTCPRILHQGSNDATRESGVASWKSDYEANKTISHVEMAGRNRESKFKRKEGSKELKDEEIENQEAMQRVEGPLVQGSRAAAADEDHLKKLSREPGGKPVDEVSGLNVDRRSIDDNFWKKC